MRQSLDIQLISSVRPREKKESLILSVCKQVNTARLIETVRLCYDKLMLLHASYFKQHYNEFILNIETWKPTKILQI